MNSADLRLYKLVDELLEVLDEDIDHIRLSLEAMDKLRALVIKRDEEELKVLLAAIRYSSADYKTVETRRQVIRNQLAGILGCRAEQMNLSNLRAHLPAEKGELVGRKQKEVSELVRKLRTECMLTEMLLKECSRFNNIILRKIFGNGLETVTYNGRGKASWQAQSKVVNLRL